MDYENVFGNREAKPGTLDFWLRMILLKGAGVLVRLEDLAISAALGLRADWHRDTGQSRILQADPLKSYEEIQEIELMQNLQPFVPVLGSIRCAIYRDFRPAVKSGYQVYSPHSSFAYALARDPDPRWENRVGNFMQLTLIERLKADTAENGFVSTQELREYLHWQMHQKNERLMTLFPDYTGSGIHEQFSAQTIVDLIFRTRHSLRKSAAPWQIITSVTDHVYGYRIEPLPQTGEKIEP